MPVYTTEIPVKTAGFCDIHKLTEIVTEALVESRLEAGIITVFAPGATAGITTIEFEPGALQDFAEAIERIAPQDATYHHNDRWRDGNGFSHIRASLLGASLSVPFFNRKIALGTWQDIVVVDFDNQPRNRRIVVQIHGER